MNDLFENYGISSGGMLHVSPAEALQLCARGVVLLDVREEFLTAFKRFNVEHIIYMPMSLLEKNLSILPFDINLIVADSVGLNSREAIKLLIEKGFSHLANLAGGLVEWERDGLPIELDKKERLSGSCMCQLKPRENKAK
ncbi:MAG: rhodanese-like domain-containing protein [Bacteroidia bacterium]|nr:rhodanese-like domain-containing protein [Bacteroidia bacterium]